MPRTTTRATTTTMMLMPSHYYFTSLSFVLFVFFLSLFPSPTMCTVIVSSIQEKTNDSSLPPSFLSPKFVMNHHVFPSRAAGFGMKFLKGVRYGALLMEPDDGDIYLCGNTTTSSSSDSHTHHDDDNNNYVRMEDGALPVVHDDYNSLPSLSSITGNNALPVALLVKRGKCSYETKARVASSKYNRKNASSSSSSSSSSLRVHFVIVYNDVDTMHHNDDADPNQQRRQQQGGEDEDDGLITMMPDDDNDATATISSSRRRLRANNDIIRELVEGEYEDDHYLLPSKSNYNELYPMVGLVFVSYHSGMELQNIIRTNSQSSYLFRNNNKTIHDDDDDDSNNADNNMNDKDSNRKNGGSANTIIGTRIFIDGEDDSTKSILSPEDEATVMGMAFTIFLVGCLFSSSLFLNAARTNVMGGGGGEDGFSSSSTVGRMYYLNYDMLLQEQQQYHQRLRWGDNEEVVLIGGGNVDSRLGGGGGSGDSGDSGRRRNRRSDPRRRSFTRRRINGLRLLTMEEVEALPTRKYCRDDNSFLINNSSDTIPTDGGGGGGGGGCSSVELRGSIFNRTFLHNAEEEEEEDVEISPLCLRGRERKSIGGGRSSDESSPPKNIPRGRVIDDEKNSKLLEHHQTMCSICLDDFEPDESLRVLPCLHVYHSECIFPWLTERSPTCPLCKAMFKAMRYCTDGEEEEEGGYDDNDRYRHGNEVRSEEIHEEVTDENGSGHVARDRQQRRRRIRVDVPQATRMHQDDTNQVNPLSSQNNSISDGRIIVEGRILRGRGGTDSSAVPDNNIPEDGHREESLLPIARRSRWRTILGSISIHSFAYSSSNNNTTLEEPLLDNSDANQGHDV